MQGVSGKQCLIIGLLITAVVGIFIARNRLEFPARAQAMSAGVSDGRILVVPIQLGRDRYGIAMADTVAERLWVYEMQGRTMTGARLRLLAARSFKYDKLLDEYNTAEPRPHQVKELLEKLSQKQQGGREENLKGLLDVENIEQEGAK